MAAALITALPAELAATGANEPPPIIPPLFAPIGAVDAMFGSFRRPFPSSELDAVAVSSLSDASRPDASFLSLTLVATRYADAMTAARTNAAQGSQASP